MDDLVKAVRNHARTHYNEGGWDYVVECWEDSDIADEVRGAADADEAIRRVGAIVGIVDEYRSEVIAAGEW